MEGAATKRHEESQELLENAAEVGKKLASSEGDLAAVEPVNKTERLGESVLSLRGRIRDLPPDASSAGFLPCLARLGWVRHLPCDIGVAFLFVIEACLSQLKGDAMHRYMEGLWVGAERCKKTKREQRALDEAAKRFAAEYGKQWESTLPGALKVLIDLGLVIQYEVDGQEVLDVPDTIPTPEQRLNLSDEEKQRLLHLARQFPRTGPAPY